MKKKYFNNEQKLKYNRMLHNIEVLKKMREGKSLIKYDAFLSWYPPRPTIKKDLNAINILYKDKTNISTLSKKKLPLKVKHLTIIK